MFGFLKSKEKNKIISSPVKGELIQLKKVNDPTFAEEILGKGFAVIPQNGSVAAPADGLVNLVFETKHAISMTTTFGAELLIHVGIDTVNLKGEFFKSFVSENQSVKKGDLLLEFDIKAIQDAGYDVTTPVVVCNSDDFSEIDIIEEKEVEQNEEVMHLVKSKLSL